MRTGLFDACRCDRKETPHFTDPGRPDARQTPPEIVMWFRSSAPGSEQVFARKDNLTSYAMGHLKATYFGPPLS